MIVILDCASVSRALSYTDLDPDLRALIGLRVWHLHVEQGRPLGTGFRLVVVQGGDTPNAINAALGCAITGNEAEAAAYDWIEDHGLFYEIAINHEDILIHVFAEAGPSLELGLHLLCLSHFWPDGEGSGL
jgi:hypothetical protein